MTLSTTHPHTESIHDDCLTELAGLQCDPASKILSKILTPRNFSHVHEVALSKCGSALCPVFKPLDDIFVCNDPAATTDIDLCWIVDADDTLWEDGLHFAIFIDELCGALLDTGISATREEIVAFRDNEGVKMAQTYGFGPKGFLASLHATWDYFTGRDEITAQKPASLFNRVVEELSNGPHKLRPETHEFLSAIAATANERLVLFTQGAIDIQVGKIARSKLAPYFASIAVGLRKDVDAYQTLIARLPFKATRYVVVGNSLSHEVAPALELGHEAVHLQNPNAWQVGNHAVLSSSGYVSVTSLLHAFDSLRRHA